MHIMNIFELINTQINSKLGNYTHSVHKSILWRPLSWLVIKSIQSSGLHPLGGAPNGHKDGKKTINSKAGYGDLWVIEFISTQINLKLGSYTY
jgi:hypothetical protein